MPPPWPGSSGCRARRAAHTARPRTTATQNGYTDGVGGVTVYPIKDPANNRRLWVTITAPVNTFFMKIFGIHSLSASRMSKAEYVLPVPMGSPENYYGNFGLTRGLTSTSTTIQTTRPTTTTRNFDPPTAVPSDRLDEPVAGRSAPSTRTTLEPDHRQLPPSCGARSTSRPVHRRRSRPRPRSTGSQVRRSGRSCPARAPRPRHARSRPSCRGTAARVGRRRPDDGQPDDDQDALQPVGQLLQHRGLGRPSVGRQPTSSNANFRVRLTALEADLPGQPHRVDRHDPGPGLRYTIVTVTPTPVTTTTTLADKNLQGPGSGCTTGVADCYEANGPALNPRGFWATMNTEGAANINGDAFQPYYDTATSTAAPACSVVTGDRACYDADNYYNYAVEMPAGTTNGSVYVYDPVFCAVSVSKGTGDRWFSGTQRGHLARTSCTTPRTPCTTSPTTPRSRRPAGCSSRSMRPTRRWAGAAARSAST